METKDYLNYIVHEIHRTIVATVLFQIEQDHCLHCGNCMNVCPVGAVVRK